MKFKTKIQRGGEGDAWMLVMIPRTFTDDGTHNMMFNKAMQKGANATAGDLVELELEPAPGK